MNSVTAIFRIVLALATVGFCKGHIDLATYQQMPPLYTVDDYNACLQQPSASYCMVYAEIQPDNNSVLWQQISDYQNSWIYYYRHDQLYRGVCTSKCKEYPPKSRRDSWDVRAVQPKSDNVQMAKILYEMSRKQKSISQHEQQLHECVNGEMQEKYNLSVKTFVTYCDSPREPLEKVATYQQMPPLYTVDDYNACLQQPSASYCMVYAEIQPDNNSVLWQQISDYQNSWIYYYRHDQLYRGVCTSKCKEYPPKSRRDSWDVRAVQPKSDNVQMAKILYEMSRKQKSISQHEQQLHECVNGEMQEKYNLSVKTFVTYCDSPREPLEKVATYQQMPPLYTVDDYNACLQQPSASYCMVYAEIQPDNNSVLWQQISDYQNSWIYYYRHDQLYRGVCTSKCKEYPPKSRRDSWDVRAVQPKSDNVQMAKILYEMSRKQKSISQHEQQLHECVNGEMQEKYNLSVKTFVTYCDSPREPLEKGFWYTYTVLIFGAIGILNILSTLYDIYLKTQQHEKETNNNYFDTNHNNTVNKYLTSFSWYRNYRRLILPNNSAIGKDLTFIDGFRTLLSFTIVLEHAFLVQFMPLENSDFFEYLYSTTFILSLMHMVISIEFFFVLSGLMLFIKFDKSEYITATSSLKECATVYVRMMISRYLRYLPSLVIVILFSSNILLHLHNAPFWRHIIEPNVMLCRNTWWSNVFMTANMGVNNGCWMHTWYISADFQLYAVFLAVLVLAAKYPQYKRFIYATVGVVGLTLPSIVSYINKLQSVSTINIEDFRHMYLKGIETGLCMYLSLYSNLNGFFIGIVCGATYLKYLKHDKYRQIVGRYLFKLLPLFGWLTIFAIWYLGSKLLFMDHSIWTALYAILHKHVSVAIVATIVIIFKMCHRGGFLTWPIFRLLARISYQVYLWHFIILFTIFAKFQQPVHVSFVLVAILHIGAYVLAAVASFFIATMLEYPMAELLSVFDLKSKPKSVKKS